MLVFAVLMSNYVVPPPLAGQRANEAEDANLRADCRLANQVLETGQPAPRYDWAVSFITHCDDSGPAALAEYWMSDRIGTDRQQLGTLAYLTASLRDQRLVEAMIHVAGDQSRPLTVRLSALRVLVPYFRPHRTVSLERLENPPHLGGSVGIVDHYASWQGAHPISDTAPEQILSFLLELSESDGDATVQAAAGFLYQALERELRRMRRGSL